MTQNSTTPSTDHGRARPPEFLFDDWFDPIETGIRERVRAFIETMLEEELEAALGRGRYQHAGTEGDVATGHRHGHRTRSLTGTFGETKIKVPRARLKSEDGETKEWKSRSLRSCQRRTKAAEALIAGAYLGPRHELAIFTR